MPGQDQDQAYYNSVIIIALMIGIIIAYFIITIIRYHRRYIRLQKERIRAEITIQENERKRIANDLHDSLGPLLSAVKLNINSVEVQNQQDQLVIDKTGRYLDDIISSLRQISYNLLPHTLERRGLIEALREFTNQVNQHQRLRIQLYVLKDENVLSKEKEIHVFRMVQEIVHNTIKHAQAKNLQIGLSQEGGYLLIFSKDDGQGFDIDKIRSTSSGLGLKSLESRSEILNGVLSLESKAGQGTNYFIKIPLA